MIAIIFAGATAMFVSMFGTRIVIRFFQTRGKGQPILGKEDLGPEHHMSKAGTPTMGGLAIVVAAFAGWMVAHVRDLAFSRQAEIAWIAILVMAGMGFLDDYLKVKRAHNRGVFWKKKSYITFTLSLLLAWWMVSATNISTALSFTRSDLPGWHMPWYVWVLWAATMIWATSNAVNVTDGLDGLAAGSAMMGFLAFTIIGYVALRYRGIYSDVVNPLDLAVLAAAFAGACAGFLWFNAAPARIFMGDVGALALGTALALLALTLNTHLLLILICGINVMEAGSVGIQMIVFKASGRKKRLFKMSPIHHHFELVGWPETTVIIRFWLISGICVASALALFIADFTKQVQG
ncbi:MAG: phospho-N-acetylmuramoyl-pentapeptide-transferase [Actinomycetota bacterium]